MRRKRTKANPVERLEMELVEQSQNKFSGKHGSHSCDFFAAVLVRPSLE
jgi:hypothetical protein